MPIREYKCQDCGSRFEQLVFSVDEENGVVCPSCGAKNLKRCMSVFNHRVPGGADGTGKSSSGSSCGTCSGGTCSTCN